MLRLAAAALALAVMASPALSQTGAPAGAGQTPNSGAGIPGQPGNKNGPPAQKPSSTMGAGSTSSQTPGSTPQDASKVPGHPGGKSGPAVKSPSSSSGR
jgi:hypothetical protein